MSVNQYKSLVDKIRSAKNPAEKAELVQQKGEVSRKLFSDKKNRKDIKAEIDAINNK